MSTSLTYHEQRACLTDILYMYANLANRAQQRAAITGSKVKQSEAAAYKRKVETLQLAIDRLDAEHNTRVHERVAAMVQATREPDKG